MSINTNEADVKSQAGYRKGRAGSKGIWHAAYLRTLNTINMDSSYYKLRERYGSLPSEKLIELYLSNGLTDMAGKLISEELRRRNINSEEEAAQVYCDMIEALEIKDPGKGYHWFHVWWVLIPAFLFLIKWIYNTYFE